MMFELADSKEIGQYLTGRIDERFKSHRQFCKKCLEETDGQADSEQIQKMSNRLSQILKGEKGIQLHDLPVFCRLLEVSCEDILSAGKSHVPTSAHLTNYIAAFSKDRREWEAYVNREDSPILNADEYGKTFIDYALEAENYDLLKYLMDKQYIWFVGTDEKDFFTGFGAGTSVEKKNFPYPRNLNVLDMLLRMRDKLRTDMIALAIKHQDLEMLENLHARESPILYEMFFFTSPQKTCEEYYNPKLMEELFLADNKILEYFSEEFEITDRFGKSRFLFPFIGELIEQLLQSKNNFAEYMLKDAIRHNQYVYDQLKTFLDDTVRVCRGMYYDMTNAAVKKQLAKEILGNLKFHDEGNLVSYFGLFPGKGKKEILRSNIIQVNANSEDILTNRRISELNELYDSIHHITPNFEGDVEQ